jgi:hypothetical protein
MAAGVREARIRSLTAESMMSPVRCWQIGCGADAVVLADVAGYLGAVAGVVADGHPPAAPAADDQALQQRGAFAGRAGRAVVAAGGGVGGEDGQVGLVLGPGEVPGVVVFDQDRPFGDGLDVGVVVSVQAGGVAGPPVGVGAGVGGVVQDLDDPVVGERLEEQLTAAGSTVVAGGEGQLLLAECPDDTERRSGGGEGVE